MDKKDDSIPCPNQPPPIPISMPQHIYLVDTWTNDLPTLPCSSPPKPIPYPKLNFFNSKRKERDNPSKKFNELYGKENVKIVENLNGKRLDPEFKNPDKVLTFAKNVPLDMLKSSCDLSGNTLNSSLYLAKQLEKLQASKLKPTTNEHIAKKAAQEAAQALNYPLKQKNYHNLVKVIETIPVKPRLVPKQIDPKWKDSLLIRPNIKKQLTLDREPVIRICDENIYSLLQLSV